MDRKTPPASRYKRRWVTHTIRDGTRDRIVARAQNVGLEFDSHPWKTSSLSSVDIILQTRPSRAHVCFNVQQLCRTTNDKRPPGVGNHRVIAHLVVYFASMGKEHIFPANHRKGIHLFSTHTLTPRHSKLDLVSLNPLKSRYRSVTLRCNYCRVPSVLGVILRTATRARFRTLTHRGYDL